MRSPATTSSPRRRSSRLQDVAPSTSKKQITHTKPRRSTKTKPRTTRKPLPTPALYLQINRKFLLLFPAPTENQPNPQPLAPPPGTTGNLNVIITTLSDLRPFAGETVDWLIVVARLLFEPCGTGSLYTFTTGSLESWLDRDSDETWRIVKNGEKLRATIYEFRPGNDTPITLTKMSLREARSVTTTTSAPRATAFRHALLQCDQACIISQATLEILLTASHLMPRRLGDAGVQSAFQRFTSSTATVDTYDPLVGVLLQRNLNALVDAYMVGLWNNGPNQYEVHSFVDTHLSLAGPHLTARDPMLHDHQVTLTSHNPSLSIPPAGVFNWHYVQCVLKKVATPAYQAVDNVYHFSLPVRTEDDDESDIDFDDERNIANPPYPSYLWELSELRARQHLEAEDRNRAILTWNSGVSDG